MPGKFHHEQIQRGNDAMSKLAAARVAVCGAGALGSHLVDALARVGVVSLRAIDFDRVEEHNISTQLYGEDEVGLFKVEALRNHLFRATGVELDAVRKTLSADNARTLLKDVGLVVDAFDNAKARQAVQDHCRGAGVPCLHAGVNGDYGEVVWDDVYRVPRDVGEGDACDYPLACNLVTLVAAIVAESVIRFIASGVRESWTVTLGDFAITAFQPRSGDGE